MGLTSFDLDPGWGPIEAKLVRQASIGQRTDWAWVVLEPSIRIRGESHSQVLLGARHQGDSVWSEPGRWPIHVYVCVPEQGDVTQNGFAPDQVSIAYWGLLHQSRERAQVDKF